METIYMILALIWSILCIILFFKIWGMTNDIRQIKDFICNNPSTAKELSDAIVADIQLKADEPKEKDDNPIGFAPGDRVLNKYTNETVIISQILNKDFVECVSETGKKLGKFNKEYFIKKG